MDSIASIIVRLNAIANVLGAWLLAPIGILPGWLSATVIGAVTGVLLLVVFKYTSNQKAIKRVRNDINANLLALKLFKESAAVALRAQKRVLWGAVRLLVLALVPMAVMAVPVTLILGQLSLWYQQRPLHIGEEVVVTLKLKQHLGTDSKPEVSLRPHKAVEVLLGPVHMASTGEACWNLRARENGSHRLMFEVDGQTSDKEIAIGDGFMRVSAHRPELRWKEVLLHPWEKAFTRDSSIQAIEIDYPKRESWTCGSDYWVIYWFIVSMVAAFAFRRVLNVNV